MAIGPVPQFTSPFDHTHIETGTGIPIAPATPDFSIPAWAQPNLTFTQPALTVPTMPTPNIVQPIPPPVFNTSTVPNFPNFVVPNFAPLAPTMPALVRSAPDIPLQPVPVSTSQTQSGNAKMYSPSPTPAATQAATPDAMILTSMPPASPAATVPITPGQFTPAPIPRITPSIFGTIMPAATPDITGGQFTPLRTVNITPSALSAGAGMGTVSPQNKMLLYAGLGFLALMLLSKKH